MRSNRVYSESMGWAPFCGRRLGRLGLVSALLIANSTLGCSGDDEPKRTNDFDASVPDASVSDASVSDASVDTSDALDPLATAPAALPVTHLAFVRDVESTVYAGDNVLALFADKGLAPVDLTDPQTPVLGPEETTDAKVITVEYDAGRNVAYAVDAFGKIYLYSLRSASGFKKMAEISVPTISNKVNGLTRLGSQLYALAGDTVVPISISFAGETPNGFMVGSSFSLGTNASHILGAGDSLYVGTTSGDLQTWTVSNGVAAKAASLPLGGPIKSLLAKGSKVISAVSGVGLTVVDVGNPTAPRRIASDTTLYDISSAKLFGRTVIAALNRNMVSAIDISDLTAPRVVTSNPGTLPKYVAATNGTLFYGTGPNATVVNLPPTVTASVPKPHLTAFPLHASIPVTFSKPIDPLTANAASVLLTCGGKSVSGTVRVSPDRTAINFLPTSLLDPGVDCALDTSSVKDALGALVNGASRTSFKTASAPTGAISVPGSKAPHTPDGAFTGYQPDAGAWTGEWSDVTPARGMYTYFYADFQDNKLNLLNDWFYNADKIDPDCYNEFYVWTGSGTQQWTIRAYADRKVSVFLNGAAIDPTSAGVTGGASYGPSPNVADPHTIYELQISAAAGSWGVQLHDPGPTYHCSRLEADPTPIQGASLVSGTGTTVDTTQRPALPAAALLGLPTEGASVGTTPTLSWSPGDGTSLTMSTYQVQISRRNDFKFFTWNVPTTMPRYTVPEGVLAPNALYYWRIVTSNSAGETLSPTWNFSTAAAAYTLTTTKTGSGVVSSGETDGGARIQCGTACSASYPAGTVVSLTATPDKGYVFNAWSNGCSGREPTTQVTLNADKTCTAEFVQATSSYSVTVATEGSGAGIVTSAPAGISCTGAGRGDDVCSAPFTAGTSIQLTAKANAGSSFTGWTGDCASENATVSLDMNAAKACTAHFAASVIDAGADVGQPDVGSGRDGGPSTLDATPDVAAKYSVSVTTSSGTVASSPDGISCSYNEGDCSALFNAGTTVLLTATAAGGYAFQGWEGDCSGTANPYTLKAISTNASCSAIYELIPQEAGAPDVHTPPIDAGPTIDATLPEDVSVPSDAGVMGIVYPGTYGPATALAISNGYLYVGASAQTTDRPGGIVSYAISGLVDGGLPTGSLLPGSLSTYGPLVPSRTGGTSLFYAAGETLARYDLFPADGAAANTLFPAVNARLIAADGANVYWLDFSDTLRSAPVSSDLSEVTALTGESSGISELAAYGGTAYYLIGASVYSSPRNTLVSSGTGTGYSLSVSTNLKGEVYYVTDQSDGGVMRSLFGWQPQGDGGGLSELDTQPGISSVYVDDDHGAGLIYYSQDALWWSASYTQAGKMAVTDPGNIRSAVLFKVNKSVPTVAWIRSDGTVAAAPLTTIN